MTKSKAETAKIAVIIVVAVLQIWGVVWLLGKLNPNTKPVKGKTKLFDFDSPDPVDVDKKNDNNSNNSSGIVWYIQRGSNNREMIEFLQKYLNRIHKSGIKQDGIWGPKTEAAVIRAGLNNRLSNQDIKRMMAEYNKQVNTPLLGLSVRALS